MSEATLAAIIAGFIGLVGVLLAQFSEQRRYNRRLLEDRESEALRAEDSVRISQERTQQESLRAYFDRMLDLLVREDLRISEQNSEPRVVARSYTLSTLRGLEGFKKGELLRFLYNSSLIGSVVSDAASDVHTSVIALTRADLRNVTLNGAVFPGADLSQALLDGASLMAANLVNANLSAASLEGSIMTFADLRGVNLAYASIKDTELTGADLSGANLTNATLEGAVLSAAELSDASMNYAILAGADLSGANLTNASLEGADLSGADLTGANLTNARLEGAELTGAYLTDADLTGVELTDEQRASAAEI